MLTVHGQLQNKMLLHSSTVVRYTTELTEILRFYKKILYTKLVVLKISDIE